MLLCADDIRLFVRNTSQIIAYQKLIDKILLIIGVTLLLYL